MRLVKVRLKLKVSFSKSYDLSARNLPNAKLIMYMKKIVLKISTFIHSECINIATCTWLKKGWNYLLYVNFKFIASSARIHLCDFKLSVLWLVNSLGKRLDLVHLWKNVLIKEIFIIQFQIRQIKNRMKTFPIGFIFMLR